MCFPAAPSRPESTASECDRRPEGVGRQWVVTSELTDERRVLAESLLPPPGEPDGYDGRPPETDLEHAQAGLHFWLSSPEHSHN